MRVRLIADDEPPIVVSIGESEFDVRRLSDAARREIQGAHRRAMREARVSQDPDALATYLQAVEDDLLDASLIDWRGLDGNPPLTRENKLRLPESVKEAIRTARETPARADLEQAAAKNSSGPSGTPSA
jgi:hypothetical protein